ncbi:hypothetical protein DW884_15840 [Ruminococcus sp. AM40-10AC]|nr:hypothetical protein DW884_15840 [Ruminococcus sp. AM40-10AC]
MRKKMMKIKIFLRQNAEKSISRKRYFYLFVCLGVFISEIQLPRIPTYFLKGQRYICNIYTLLTYKKYKQKKHKKTPLRSGAVLKKRLAREINEIEIFRNIQ